MESMKITGKVDIRVYNSKGELKAERLNNNLVVTAGKNYLATWLAAASQAGKFMSYIALGTGTDAPAAGDTALQAELATRVQGTLSASTNVWENVATFGAGVNTDPAISEAGLFSASSSGTMFARTVFTPFEKEAGDSVEFTWQVTLS